MKYYLEHMPHNPELDSETRRLGVVTSGDLYPSFKLDPGFDIAADDNITKIRETRINYEIRRILDKAKLVVNS